MAPPEDRDVAEPSQTEQRRLNRFRRTGRWNLFTLDQQDHLVANFAPVVTTVTAVFAVLWGLIAVGSLTLPRAGYGTAALLVGGALYGITRAFTTGERWALPVVAVTPVVVAVAVYLHLTPPFPMTSPGQLVVWAVVVVTGLSPLTLAVGPAHPSWVSHSPEQ